MKYRIRHQTTYDYESPVLHGRHIIHQRPRQLSRQNVLRSSLTVDPSPVWSSKEDDYFGNAVDTVEVLEPHDRLVVVALSELEVLPPVLDRAQPPLHQPWDAARARIHSDPTCYESREFCLDSPLVRHHASLESFAASTFTPGRPLFEAVLEFNHRIYTEFTYDPAVTDITTPLGQVMREKRGVCQDFAHVAVGALRSLGLAARYVSGYLETVPPPGKERLVGADASHAWASVLIPDFGWLDFDPTNDVLPGERHIVVAWGRDFSDVSPLRGVVHGGGRHTIRVGVDVAPQPSASPPSPSSLPAPAVVAGSQQQASTASGQGQTQSQQRVQTEPRTPANSLGSSLPRSVPIPQQVDFNAPLGPMPVAEAIPASTGARLLDAQQALPDPDPGTPKT